MKAFLAVGGVSGMSEGVDGGLALSNPNFGTAILSGGVMVEGLLYELGDVSANGWGDLKAGRGLAVEFDSKVGIGKEGGLDVNGEVLGEA